jgi:hypothetical protein
MRLIEVDDTEGVRAAVTTFAGDGSSLQFVLVPLAYLAEALHHVAVVRAARSCDVLIRSRPPGNGRRSTDAGLGPEFWESIGRAPNIRLRSPYGVWHEIGQFVPEWSPAAGPPALPGARRAVHRILNAAISPLVAVAPRVMERVGDREIIARALEGDVRAAERTISGRGRLRYGERYVNAKQPVRTALAHAVRQYHADHRRQRRRVAVVHWPDSIQAVALELGSLGYAPAQTTWIPVFAWLPGQGPSDGR